MTETTTADPILTTLIATHALLAEGPERWTQKAFARDRVGNAVSISGESAVCFCLDGALERVALPPANRSARVFLSNRLSGGILGFNDDPATTYEMVLDVLVSSIVARREEFGGNLDVT